MRKRIIALVALIGASTAVSAAPAIDFTGLGWPSFNSTGTDSTSFAGIAIGGYTYASPTTYAQDKGFLWLRSNTNDHGLGYCSNTGSGAESCGAPGTTGGGDYNELSNNYKSEIIRLTLPTGKVWTDIQVSSLDEGGTSGDETGTLYWSSSATPDLTNGSTSYINFSHDSVWGNGSGTVEGSIFAYLESKGFDETAKYLFFRAGKYNGFGSSSNGNNNDYLVWGVNVTTPVPEPETYAMLLAGLGLLGFAARRRKRKGAAAA